MRRRRKGNRIVPSGNVFESPTSPASVSRDNSPLRLIRDIRKPFKAPCGRGLGKAGAKRLGRMIQQAMQPKIEVKGKGAACLPKSPIGLLEYHFQTEKNSTSEADSPTAPSSQVTRFICQAVAKYKAEGGLSMADLKQMLAAEGCNLNKSNLVNDGSDTLVIDESSAKITRSGSNSQEDENQEDTSEAHIDPVKSPKLKEELKQNTTANKCLKGTEKSHHRGKITHALKSKSPHAKSKPNRTMGKSHHQSKNRKNAAKFFEQKKKACKAHKKAVKLFKAQKKGTKSSKNKKLSKVPVKKCKTMKHQKPPVKNKKNPKQIISKVKKGQPPYKTNKKQPGRRQPTIRFRLKLRYRRDLRRL